MTTPTKPELFRHQSEYLERHSRSKYHGLLWSMGAGKTRAILENVNRLYEEHKIDWLIVIAPNGVHTNWLRRQIPLWLDVPYDSLVWDSKKANHKSFRLAQTELVRSENLKVLCMNVEAMGYRTSAAVKFIQYIVSRGAQRAFLVVDESSSIKSTKANRSKVIVSLARQCAYRRILTGTPITQSPFDIWMQGEALNKNIWHMNYFIFRQHFGSFKIKRFGNRSFEECVGYRNMDELRRTMLTFCSEVRKEDCIDLPPKLYKVVEVPLTEEQVKAYKQMKDYYCAQVDEELVIVDSALTRLTKLHQIVTGHIKNEDGITSLIPHNRINVLIQTLEELDCKRIIYCQYVQPIKEIMAALGDTAVEYSGRTSNDDRQTAVDRFQTDPSIQTIVISLQSSGAYGLDLFAAGAVLYYCNGYSLERRMQSEDRAHRPGQTHDNVLILDMISSGTVDESVQAALIGKIDVASHVTSLMSAWLR